MYQYSLLEIKTLHLFVFYQSLLKQLVKSFNNIVWSFLTVHWHSRMTEDDVLFDEAYDLQEVIWRYKLSYWNY